MKKHLMKHILLVYFGVLSIASTFAKDNYYVFDLITNQTYTYQQQYIELVNSKWNFYESIDVSYPFFTQLSDSNIQKNVNKRIKQVMIGQLETDVFKVKLFNHLNEVVDTYLELYNKKVDRLGYYQDNQYKFTPDLEDVEYQFVSCYDNIVAMVIKFEYSTSFRNKKLLERINYYQVYYFDLKTGEEFDASDVFVPSAKKKIEALVIQTSQKNMAYVDREYIRKKVFGESDHYQSNRYSYYDKGSGYKTVVEADLNSLRDTSKVGLINFDLYKHGFSFLKAFSISYFIPAYQACTKQMFGYSMEARLKLSEILPYLNPKGPYRGLVRIKIPKQVQYPHMNNPLFPSHNHGRHQSLGVSDNMPYRIKDTLVTLVKETRPISKKRKNGEWYDTIELLREMLYEKGKLVELRSYSSSKLHTEWFFAYDSRGNLSKSTRQQGGQLISSTDYIYDDKKNLIQKNMSDYKKPVKRYHYTYFEDFALEESYGTLYYNQKIDGRFNKIYLNAFAKADSVYYTPVGKHSKSYYKYSPEGQLLYSYRDSKKPEKRTNYVYDTLGRLMAYEYDNGRYLNQWTYDSTGNITRHAVQDGLWIQRSNDLFYDEKGHLIRIETIQSQYSRKPYVRHYKYYYD